MVRLSQTTTHCFRFVAFGRSIGTTSFHDYISAIGVQGLVSMRRCQHKDRYGDSGVRTWAKTIVLVRLVEAPKARDTELPVHMHKYVSVLRRIEKGGRG